MKTPARPCAYLVASLIVAVASTAGAGPYENPQNLKVLPKDISPAELRKTMKGFSLGVGARCSQCHVGKPDESWQKYDYASDEKELKQVARQMIRMMDDINNRYLAQLTPTDHERVRVTCVTCHRGQRLPRQMHEVLDEALAKGNLPAAIEKYTQLKKEYYGSQTFDFTELTLTEYARALVDRGRTEEAFGVARFAVSEFPTGYQSHYLLGDLHLLKGDRVAARAEYEKALQLAPDQTWIKEQIDALEKQN